MDEGETARDLGEASKFLQKSGCRVPWAPSLAAPSEPEGPGVLSQGVLRPLSWSDSPPWQLRPMPGEAKTTNCSSSVPSPS